MYRVLWGKRVWGLRFYFFIGIEVSRMEVRCWDLFYKLFRGG